MSSPFTLLLSIFFFLFLFLRPSATTSGCDAECDLALASYYISPNQNLTYIASLFGIPFSSIDSDVLPYNPALSSKDSIFAGSRVNVPFQCRCIDGEFLAGTFSYVVSPGDTYGEVAASVYANLTTADWLQRRNSYISTRVPEGVTINVTVNCFCGDVRVSSEYGLFVTYPLQPGENLRSVAKEFGFVNDNILEKYNPGVDFSAGEGGTVFLPTKGPDGSFHPISLRTKGTPRGLIAGISVAGLLIFSFVVYLFCEIVRRKKAKRVRWQISTLQDERHLFGQAHAIVNLAEEASNLGNVNADKSVEFSYEEIANATNNFSVTKKIGEGAFGMVYYAELRGEKVAIKKMSLLASKEFISELEILTNVYHSSLVRLIGYCKEHCLFLVYEYVEKDNLSKYMSSLDKEPLTWPKRVQIALDAAAGLEYIHSYTLPPYVHRDIKSANILIDKNFRGKVADFGLTRFTKDESVCQTSQMAGTFGYMPPESSRGEFSCKSDVYAFGVVLYELISAKKAILQLEESISERRGLVDLFEGVLNQPDPEGGLHSLVDPRLGNDYLIESVYKMALLARSCTRDKAAERPTMQSVKVELFTLSSTIQNFDSFLSGGNQSLIKLMSGK